MGWLLAILISAMVIANNDVEVISKNKDVAVYSNEKKSPVKLNKFYDFNTTLDRYKENPKKFKHYYAEELFCYYADNFWDTEKLTEFTNKLKDTDIKLSGTVHMIRNNAIDGTYIVFRQKRAGSIRDGWMVITCNFSDKLQKERVMKLKKGDNVTLIGHVSKYNALGFNLYDCYLFKAPSE